MSGGTAFFASTRTRKDDWESSPMLYISGEALAALDELKAEAGVAGRESLLLYLDERGELGIGLAEIEETDRLTSEDGPVDLVVTEALAAALDGMLLDVALCEDGQSVEFILVDSDDQDVDIKKSIGFGGSGRNQ